jgi:hypothetical protein
MKTYEVHLIRPAAYYADVVVEAETAEEAGELAILHALDFTADDEIEWDRGDPGGDMEVTNVHEIGTDDKYIMPVRIEQEIDEEIAELQASIKRSLLPGESYGSLRHLQMTIDALERHAASTEDQELRKYETRSVARLRKIYTDYELLTKLLGIEQPIGDT